MFRTASGAPMRAPTVSLIASLVLLTATAFPTNAFATTAAGRTAGTFAVSPTGAATYTIPIWSPPGPHGMQPSIALTYNSQQGNGPVGVGWGISGLSSIYRCNLTLAQDAAPAPVALVIGDGYCMDGQRLRLTSTGNYGEDGSTYQTEVANFVDVTAHGSAGNGPAYWTAQDKNGRTYTYGNAGNSQVIAPGTSTALSWQLNEVSDPYGNTMTIAYNQTSGSTPCIAAGNLPAGLALPCTISWTPSSQGSGTYNYAMTFTYSANVPQSSTYKYVAGSSVQNIALLSSIAIAYSGAAVKTYYLTYTQQTTGTYRDVLAQVQECSGSGTSNCLAPTVMTYQSGTVGISDTATTAVSSASGTVYTHYDLNRDGYPDLIYQNGSYWYVAFGSSSGFGTPISTGISSSSTLLVGDLLGNGEDGLLADNGGTWYYYTWNGSSFSSSSTGLAYESGVSQFLLADINGDGLPDLVELAVTPGVGYGIYTRLNTSSTTSVSFSSTRVTALSNSDSELVDASIASASDGATVYGTLRRLDFNGDGREDILFHRHDQTTTLVTQGSPPPPGTINIHILYELLSNGSTFTPYEIASTGSLSNIAFLDWNSDTCTDYVVNTTIYISGCNGSAGSSISIPSGTVIGAMDWDGDGRTDVVVANGSTIGVYLSTGTGIGSLESTSLPYSASDTYFTFKPAGDGLAALGYYPTAGGAIQYYKHNGAGQAADLLSSVTDAFGNYVQPTYVSLIQNNYTPYTDATYPYQNWMGPLYVVNKAVFSDPSSGTGGTYNQTFWYWGAWTNLWGRGWQSFYATELTDSRNSLNTLHYYERSFPFTGMDNEDRLSNSTFDLSQTDRTLASLVTLSSTPNQERYFAYFSNSTTYTKEVGGSENGQLITTSSTNYTLDNFGNPTSISTTVTDNDPNSPYVNDTWTKAITNTWDYTTNPNCANLLSTSQVAYSVTPTGPTPVTIASTYTPDLVTTHCDYASIATQSNSGSAYGVTESFGYDSFGNVNSDKVSGASMAARTTTANWGTTGQFPMSITDPTNAQTQFNYNFSFGLKSSVTDPNTLTTSWAYNDGFGRVNQETRPDGTYTTLAYTNCEGTSGCLLNAAGGINLQIDVYAKNASLITQAENFYDSIDRLLVATKLMMGGSTFSRVDTRYDSLGRVAQQSFPCVYSSLTTTCTYWTTNTYDVLNRLTQSQRPISSTNSNPQTTTYAYVGRTTTVTDALTNQWTTIKDVNGWLRRTKDPYGYYVTLAYDTAGNKTAVTDSASNSLWSATYKYGVAAFPASIADIDMGTWSFTYDALGEKTGWTDAKSQSFTETYDALSRPTSRSEPDYFTQWTWGSSASSHNIYKLQSVCTGTGTSPTNCTANPGYSESETYDSDGRLSQRSMTLPGEYGGSFAYTRGYDANTGLLSTLTYPASYPSTYSLQLQYGYSEGILQTVTDVSDTPNVTVWDANTTDPMGHVTEETIDNGNIVTNRSYDAVTGWLGSAQTGVGGGSGIKNLGFLYDLLGDVTQRQDNNLGLTENVYYDNDYRFSYSKLNSTQNLSVSYATNGNITSRTDIASGANWTYSPTQIHAVTQAGSSAYQYGYDANGNATSRQGSSITWASYNYPTSISAGSGSTAETVALSYGPDRQRWQQYYTGNSTTETTDYVGKQMEVVVSGGVTDYRHYIYGGAGVAAVYSRKSNGTNTFSYLLSDHQASVASIVNSSGAQVAGESFTAFGNRRNPATWSGPDTTGDLTTIAGITREGYTFQTALGLWMGMNHMNGRVQDAVTGRMLSADPNVPDPANTQSYNRYSYVNNNPLSRIDPTGFWDGNIDCKIVSRVARNKTCSGGDGGSDGGGTAVAPSGDTDQPNPSGQGAGDQSPAQPGGASPVGPSPNDPSPQPTSPQPMSPQPTSPEPTPPQSTAPQPTAPQGTPDQADQTGPIDPSTGQVPPNVSQGTAGPTPACGTTCQDINLAGGSVESFQRNGVGNNGQPTTFTTTVATDANGNVSAYSVTDNNTGLPVAGASTPSLSFDEWWAQHNLQPPPP